MHFLQDMAPPILPTCRPMWNENIGPEEWGQRRCFTTRETGNTGKMKGKYWNKDFGNTGKFSLLKFELQIWWNQSLNGTESYVSQVGLISTTLRGPARHSPRLSRWRPSTSNAFERECLKHFKEVVNSWTLVVRNYRDYTSEIVELWWTLINNNQHLSVGWTRKKTTTGRIHHRTVPQCISNKWPSFTIFHLMLPFFATYDRVLAITHTHLKASWRYSPGLHAD